MWSDLFINDDDSIKTDEKGNFEMIPGVAYRLSSRTEERRDGPERLLIP
jgi:hypothetical protein